MQVAGGAIILFPFGFWRCGERIRMNPVWMILVTLAGVGGLGVVFAVQQRMKRRRAALRPVAPLCVVEDHRITPPLEVLMRESLVNPKRTLNLQGWDNSPPTDEEVDLDGVDFEPDPTLIDRNFFANRGHHGDGS